MSMETLDTDSVLLILSYLQYNDVLNFSTVFRGQFKAVDIHWRRLRMLDVDEFLDNQISTIDLSLIKNLRTLKLTKNRFIEEFENLFTAINTHCHQIEVLNIPGIPLKNEDVETLSSLTTLKSLSFNCEDVDDNVLGQLFQSNPGLQEVNISDFDYQLDGTCFEKLPNSIKSLNLGYTLDPDIIFRCMENWQLESLRILFEIDPEHMRILSQHTTFKSLGIQFSGDDSMLQTLLQNNPQLVQLQIVFLDAQQCSHFFRYLPLTLKDLRITGDFVFSDNIFLDRLKYLNLETLKIDYTQNSSRPRQINHSLSEYNTNFVRSLVGLIPNIQNLGLTLIQSISLQPLEQLKGLSCLQLSVYGTEMNNELKVISENCLNLEVLDLQNAKTLSSEGVEHLVKLPKLKTLVVCDARELFNADCMIILKGCRTLETVSIDDCTGLDENSVPLLMNDTLRVLGIPILPPLLHLKDFTDNELFEDGTYCIL